MPRPSKKRRVCREPADSTMIPAEKQNIKDLPVVEMTVDEYESIRLIDLLELSQEECAARMNVARTTAQAIYNSARKKMAESLVCRKELRISGGNYYVCEGCRPAGQIETRTGSVTAESTKDRTEGSGPGMICQNSCLKGSKAVLHCSGCLKQ